MFFWIFFPPISWYWILYPNSPETDGGEMAAVILVGDVDSNVNRGAFGFAAFGLKRKETKNENREKWIESFRVLL